MGHGIIPTEAGWDTFGWLIAVFLVGTILFALSLEFIIRYIRRTESAGSEAWAKFRQGHGHGNGSEDITLIDQEGSNHAEGFQAFTRLRSAGSLRRRRVVRQRDVELGSVEEHARS
jgi:hypothetical protein